MQHTRINNVGRRLLPGFSYFSCLIHLPISVSSPPKCAGILAAAVVNPLASKSRTFAIITGQGVAPGLSVGRAVRQHVHDIGAVVEAPAVVGARELRRE